MEHDKEIKREKHDGGVEVLSTKIDRMGVENQVQILENRIKRLKFEEF